MVRAKVKRTPIICGFRAFVKLRLQSQFTMRPLPKSRKIYERRALLKSAIVCGGHFRVFEDGTVYQIKNGIETLANQCNHGIKAGSNGTQYQCVCYSENGKQKNINVHRLIAEAFIPNPEHKPQVNHIDGNRSNNNVSNLEWCTPKENVDHAYRTGLMKQGVQTFPCKRCGKRIERSKDGYCTACRAKIACAKKREAKENEQAKKFQDVSLDGLSETAYQCVIRAKQGMSQSDIGREIGISRERVRQLLTKAYEGSVAGKEMPRTIILNKKTHEMTRLLLGYGINGNTLAPVINSCPATARKKIAEPKYLTVGDLMAINRKWAIPLDELRRAIC